MLHHYDILQLFWAEFDTHSEEKLEVQNRFSRWRLSLDFRSEVFFFLFSIDMLPQYFLQIFKSTASSVLETKF